MASVHCRITIAIMMTSIAMMMKTIVFHAVKQHEVNTGKDRGIRD